LGAGNQLHRIMQGHVGLGGDDVIDLLGLVAFVDQ
jgi:hypothetical protein